ITALFIPSLFGRLTYGLGLQQGSGLLARYFVGEQAGVTPAHLVRIDREINFGSVAELGAMPFPSTVVWTGKLVAPQTGQYLFTIEADDCGWLLIDGQSVIPDPGAVTKTHSAGQATLSRGAHRITVGERNIGGDAAIHLYWRPPHHDAEIVPSSALIPDRP
ncbi:MAG TPA: PA14 domain-containing protein, partial [Candidatus Binataceae bacterium]